MSKTKHLNLTEFTFKRREPKAELSESHPKTWKSLTGACNWNARRDATSVSRNKQILKQEVY